MQRYLFREKVNSIGMVDGPSILYFGSKSDAGNFVLYSDVKAIEEERDKLKAELAALEETVKDERDLTKFLDKKTSDRIRGFDGQIAALEVAVKEKDENFNQIIEVWQMKHDLQVEQIAALTAELVELKSRICNLDSCSVIKSKIRITAERDEYRSLSNTQKALLGYQEEAIKKQAEEVGRLREALENLRVCPAPGCGYDLEGTHAVVLDNHTTNEKLLHTINRQSQEIRYMDMCVSLLKECRATLEMWKDVAPAISLCADIDRILLRIAQAALKGEQPFTGIIDPDYEWKEAADEKF